MQKCTVCGFEGEIGIVKRRSGDICMMCLRTELSQFASAKQESQSPGPAVGYFKKGTGRRPRRALRRR